LHIIETTVSIHQTQWWVVQTRAWQTQNGGQPPSRKNRKIAMSQQRFDRLPWNLARWHIFTRLTLSTLIIWNFFKKLKMARTMCDDVSAGVDQTGSSF